MIITERCEVNIVRHCNNSCAACNHASPLAEPYYMEPETLRRDLAALSKIMHTGFFCLQGGEPLLHGQILDFMDVQKESGFADKYGILSNGRLLPHMPDEFWQKAHDMDLELRVSMYDNLPPEIVPAATKKAVEFGVNFRPCPTPTFWKLFEEQPDGGAKVWASCYARGCHTVHEGYFYHCPLAAFFPKQFHGWDEHIDGIKIEGTTEEQMAAFIAHPEPLKTCSKCTAGNHWIPWHETRDKDEWLKEAKK